MATSKSIRAPASGRRARTTRTRVAKRAASSPAASRPASRSTAGDKSIIHLTYAQLGTRLKVSADGARKAAQRHGWPINKDGSDVRVAVTADQLQQVLEGRPAGAATAKAAARRRVAKARSTGRGTRLVAMSLDDFARQIGVTHDAARKTVYRHKPSGWSIDPDPRKQPPGFKVNPSKITVKVDPSFGRSA